jgi:hypothetical protein
MNIALRSSLEDAAVSTFEQVVFLLPDTPPDETQRAVGVRAVATISFSGPADGVLQVHACEGLLPRLTANMLGDEVVNEPLQLDALGEIANIICGQLFPHLAVDRAFIQTPPEVVVCCGPAPAPGGAPAAAVELGLESSRADIVLYLSLPDAEGGAGA